MDLRIAENYEKAVDQHVAQLEIYSHYLKTVNEQKKTTTITLPEFMRLLLAAFQGTTTVIGQAPDSSQRLFIRGLRRKGTRPVKENIPAELKKETEKDTKDDDENKKDDDEEEEGVEDESEGKTETSTEDKVSSLYT